MISLLKKLRTHKFEAHLTVFTLMVLTSVALYFTASAGTPGLIWALLGVFAFSNLLALVVE